MEYRLNIPSNVSFRFDLQTNRGTGGISEIDLTINSATFATLTTDPTDITVENSALTEIGSKVGSNWQIADTTATAKNSANTTLATAAQVAGVATTLTIPDITKTDSDGTTSSVPAGVNVTCTPNPKDLFTKFVFPLGLAFTDTFTIDSDSVGTYTSTSNDGASGTITFSINGGAYAAFSNPTTLAVNDTIRVQRTTTTALGWVKITGTFV